MNRTEQKERLEIEAHKHLYNLYNSQPIGRDELPAVYLSEGVLRGMCIAFGLCFEVDLRRKITFFKGDFVDEGRYWFEVENEGFSEEDAKERMQSYRKEVSRISLMRQNLVF